MLDSSAIGIAHVVEEGVAIDSFVPLLEEDRERHRLLVVQVDLGLVVKRVLVERNEFGERDILVTADERPDRRFDPRASEAADQERAVGLGRYGLEIGA